MVRDRAAWRDAQADLDPKRLVFIDETGASTKMARLYGRARRGGAVAPLRSRTGIGRRRRSSADYEQQA